MKKGFTLLEVLIVITIIAVLLLLLLPKGQEALVDAEAKKQNANEKTLHTIAKQIELDNKTLPSGNKLIDLSLLSDETKEELKKQLQALGSTNVDQDYDNVTKSFYEIDRTKMNSYGKLSGIQKDYFIIGPESPYLKNSFVSFKPLQKNKTEKTVRIVNLNIEITNGNENGNETGSENVLKMSTFSYRYGSSERATSALIKSDGGLWVWGDDMFGQLGWIYNITENKKPAQIAKDKKWKDIYVSNSMIGVTQNGEIYQWGASINQPVLLSENAEKFFTTDADKYIIKSDGSLWGWGWINSDIASGMVDKIPKFINNGPWKTISPHEKYVIGIKTDGSLWGIGDEQEGGFEGEGAEKNADLKWIPINTSYKWKDVFTDNGHTYAIQENGSLWHFGINPICQSTANGCAPGEEIFSISKIDDTSKWKQVFPGFGQTLAMKEDGTLWKIGFWLKEGVSSLPTYAYNYYETPVPFYPEKKWKTVATGSTIGFVIDDSGDMYAFGFNNSGQFGNETTNRSFAENIVKIINIKDLK